MGNPIDPVEAVGAVRKSNNVKPVEHTSPIKIKSRESDYLYSTNYILEVMKLTNLTMEHQAYVVQLRGELADVVTKIQSDMSTINQFMSKLQSNAHAGGGTAEYENHGTASPDSTTGFARNFYHMNDYTIAGTTSSGFQSNFGGDFGNDVATGQPCVSTDYQSSMQGFLTAFKQLYYSSPSSSGAGSTVSDLSTISNPYGKDFNLNSFWGNLQTAYGTTKGYDRSGFDGHVISTTPTDHPSLMQQYMYYQAQLTVNTSSKSDLIAAGGDITKVPNINFDPTKDSFDSTLNTMFGVLNSMSQSVSVSTSWTKDVPNLLDLIATNKPELYNTVNGQTQWEIGFGDGKKVTPGLYNAFSSLAYNYFWTKNPTASDDVRDNITTGGNWGIGVGDYSKSAWDWVGHQAPTGDGLSTLYMNTNSTQATISSTSSNTNTNFQQDTSSVQTINNAAQQMITNFTQGQGSTINNFRS